MANFLCFSDMHLSERFGLAGANRRVDRGDGVELRRSLVEGGTCLDWIVHRAHEEQPDGIIFAGDLFDRARPTPNEIVVAVKMIRNMAEVAPVVIIKGNHDDSLGHDATATEIISSLGFADVTVVESPQVVSFEHVELYCLPYPPLGRLVEQAGEGWSKEIRNGLVSDGLGAILHDFANRALDSSAASVLVSHVTFGGCEYAPGQIVPATDVAAPTARLGDFDAVIAGHLHKRQQIGGHSSAFYIGTPDRWTFGDEGNPAGIAWLYIPGGEMNLPAGVIDPLCIKFEDYPQAREFTTVTPAEFLAFAEEDRNAAGELALFMKGPKSFIRVKGELDDLEQLDELEQARDKLVELFAAIVLEVDVADSAEEVVAVEPGGGIGAIYTAFCEARPEVIPDDRRDDVLAEVERVHTLATDGGK